FSRDWSSDVCSSDLAHGKIGAVCNHFQMWQQLFGAQSTIETHAQKWNVGNGNQKCFRGLAGKCSSRSIGNCTAYHYWNVEISFFLYFINCEKCGFCVQSIENGFYQKNIHAARSEEHTSELQSREN